MATEPRAREGLDVERWRRERYAATRERRDRFTTLSGEPIRELYTAEDLPPEEDTGLPTEFPFTRGRNRACTETPVF